MRAFAESEIIIPDGPFEGTKFKCDRQPYTRLWFDAVDSRKWNRHFATGPTQSGKTLSCYITPLLYHLFEIGETVVCGLPTMDMAGDKWREDIQPAIVRSRYRDLMPKSGKGSKGGNPEAIQFGNGATLRFMGGGGNDKTRSAFTTRVLVITEVDGMDEAGATSREADKITQMEGRTRAYGKRKCIYGECTVSVEQGRTWKEYNAGTQSRIFMPCPHCKAFVHPTRDSLAGWQGTNTEVEAENNSCLHCPECGEAWSETDRKQANLTAVLVHRGQEIEPNGTIHGPLPETNTLGFRWDAANNLFVTAGEVGAEEWKASRSSDEDNAEKEMRQFVWALPHESSQTDSTPLEVAAIVSRIAFGPRGVLPPDADKITVHIDVHKYLLYWSALAWHSGGCPHVLDYGRHEVPSDQLGVERAILVALRELREVFKDGWSDRKPDAIWVDAGYETDTVYAFIRETRGVYLPADGLGSAQEYRRKYNKPKSTGAIVKRIGDDWHLAALPDKKILLAEVHADHWKSWAHQRLTTPIGEPGAMTLFEAPANEHLAFAKQLTAEKQVQEFEPGKGVVTKWVRERRQNHWFDTIYNACAAGNFCGIKLVKEHRQSRPTAPKKPPKRQPADPTRDVLLLERPGGWI